MVDFSTVIKSKLSTPEVLKVYNKNLKEADLSWVEEEIKDAEIENIEAKTNFDWLEIFLITIFILLGNVSFIVNQETKIDWSLGVSLFSPDFWCQSNFIQDPYVIDHNF